METIIKSVGMLCTTAYLTGILTNFIPMDYTAKAVRLAVAVYILSSLLIPAVALDYEYGLSDVIVEDYTEKAREYITRQTELQLENNISKQLDEKNIAYNSVNVHIHKQNERLEIEKIYIDGVPSRQHSAVYSLLEYGNILNIGE